MENDAPVEKSLPSEEKKPVSGASTEEISKSPDSSGSNKNSYLEMLRFFIPLAIQAASQSASWPIVASIVTHGKQGPMEYASFSQGLTVMFLIGGIGMGLIPTGMVFSKSASGFKIFCRLSNYLALCTALLQILVCLPPLDHLTFQLLLGLPPDQADIARNSLLYCIPLQLLFYRRNSALVLLYNAKQSALANNATLARIALTAIITPILVHLGAVGHFWGAVGMTIPVWAENVLMRYFAKPISEKLEDRPDLEIAPLGKQFRFSIPLSFGGMMLSFSALILAMFLSRTDTAESALPVHYLLMGAINPIGFAALRMQSVTIAFSPDAKHPSRIAQRFAFIAGVCLCFIPLITQIPAFGNWYFMKMQELSLQEARFAANALLFIAPLPLIQALRGHAEGLAAVRRRPNAIFTGQAMYFATLMLCLWVFFETKCVPDYMMGALSILSAMFVALISIRVALMANDCADEYGSTPTAHTRGTPNGH